MACVIHIGSRRNSCNWFGCCSQQFPVRQKAKE
jgi:hypothetical protein